MADARPRGLGGAGGESTVHFVFRRACENNDMPRLTHDEYRNRRVHLRADWLHGAPTAGSLTAAQQEALDAVYAPEQDLTDREAIAHRKVILRTRPELTRAAGLAYRSFAARAGIVAATIPLSSVRASIPAGRRRGRSVIRARSDPNNVVNMQLLAEALLLHARETAENARTRVTDDRTDSQ